MADNDIVKEAIAELDEETSTFDRDKLVEDTEERLANLGTDKTLEKESAESSDSSDSTPHDADDDTAADDGGDDDDPTPAEKKAEAELKEKEAEEKDGEAGKEAEGKEADAGGDGDETETVPISDAYYRAAKHMGWEDGEIEEFYSTNPKLADQTFANILESTNRSSREFAALGRARKQKESAAPDDTATKHTEKDGGEEFKGIDVEALRKEYPNDPIVDMVSALQDQNKALFDKIQSSGSASEASTQPAETNSSNAQEVAAIQQQIGSFFSDDNMKVYDDFYGENKPGAKDWQSLTPGQKANRWAVLEMADQLVAGAETYGEKMGLDEALYRAHLSVTEPIREKIMRQDIQGKVVKRNNSLSIKPSSAKSTETSDSGKKSRGKLIEDTTARLDKLNW